MMDISKLHEKHKDRWYVDAAVDHSGPRLRAWTNDSKSWPEAQKCFTGRGSSLGAMCDYVDQEIEEYERECVG